jgi:hypothetical protein
VILECDGRTGMALLSSVARRSVGVGQEVDVLVVGYLEVKRDCAGGVVDGAVRVRVVELEAYYWIEI